MAINKEEIKAKKSIEGGLDKLNINDTDVKDIYKGLKWRFKKE